MSLTTEDLRQLPPVSRHGSSPLANPLHGPGVFGEKLTPYMRILVFVSRLLLGLIFVVVGLNGFLLFIPPPPHIPGNAGAFSAAMMSSHYIYLTAGVQVIAGGLLLINQYVPLALVVLGAVIVNILTFHLTMWPQSLFPFPILVTVLWFIVAWQLRAHFAPLFVRKVDPL